MATPRTQSVGGWVVLCARSLGGDVGGSHSRPRSREEQGRARLFVALLFPRTRGINSLVCMSLFIVDVFS